MCKSDIDLATEKSEGESKRGGTTETPLTPTMTSKNRQPKAAGTKETTTEQKLNSNKAEPRGPAKRVYLMRHGESRGQRASRQQRANDPNLMDCALSGQGEYQASIIPSLLGSERYGQIGYVISSPLTRAVQTSVLGFPTKPIVIHYDLFEMGSRDRRIPIPENRPRHLKQVLADTGGEDRVDGITFAPRPTGFPKSHEKMTNKERKDRLRRVWPNLWRFCEERDCEAIAIVCHYNIIRMALPNAPSINPENAIPIECLLFRQGPMEVVGVLTNEVQELSDALTATSEKNEGILQAATTGSQEYDEDGYVVFE